MTNSRYLRWFVGDKSLSPIEFMCLILMVAAVHSRAATANSPITSNQTHWLVNLAVGQTCAAGRNENGELGDATEVNRLAPIGVDASGLTAVATGYYHSVGLKSDGTVWAWGDNSYGALGNNTSFPSPTPMQVPGISNVVSVAAGYYYSLAVKNDGTVWAWGYNGYGNLGEGTMTARLVPTQVLTITNAVAVATYGLSSYALKSDGTVWAWGYNGEGELGIGNTTTQTSPVQITALSSITAIAAGHYHALALKSDGTVWAWGYNVYGELGNGTTISSSAPVQVSSLSSAVAIAGGEYHSVAVKSDGTTWAWGLNNSGQLGNGTTTNKVLATQVMGISNAVAAGASTNNSVVLNSDASISAWGDNTYGQLGNGSTASSLVPVTASACNIPTPTITHLSSTAKRIAASQNFSFAVKNDGTVESWGQNTYGQLGDGTTTNRSSPVQVLNVNNITSVAAGWSFGLAVKSDGTVWGWGFNADGELGDGTHTNRPAAIQIPGLSNIVAVAAGQYHSLGLSSNGTVYAWGYNANGQLGDGTTTARVNAVQVIGLTNVVAIAAGAGHSLAIKADGTVWGWGYNADGELGIGSHTNQASPVQMVGISGALAIAAGQYHTLVLKNDGTVWGTGYNAYGQLGDGSSTGAVYVVAASGLTNVTDIAAGQLFSLAVKSDHTVWGFGYNGYGQLGIGTNVSQNVPTQTVVTNGFTNILSVTAGANHGLGLRTDGTFFAWGDNTYGQFGGATSTQSTVAVSVPVSGVGPFSVLTLNISPPNTGSITASPGSTDGYYQANTNVCLTAVPAATFAFSSWSGAPLDSNNCLALTSDQTVTATFRSSRLRFIPLTPCRVVDTRNPSGPFGGPMLSANSARSFAIPSSACSIPSSAFAYSLNVTVVPPSQLAYLTIWPTGQPQPLVSTLNSDGRIKANAAIVPAGNNGAVSVYVTDATDVILDIDGYFVDSNNTSALAFYPVTPCRIADTRNPAGPLGGPTMSAGQDRTFPVQTSTCGLPPTAQAYALNFTVVPQSTLAYLTTWPTGLSQPFVSTLNDLTGTVVANGAIVPAGSGGSTDVYVTDQTDVIIDVNGYFAPAGPGGLSLYTVAPCRVVDTRLPLGSPPFSGSITMNSTSSGCGLTSSAAALVSNATVVPQGSLPYLTLWPSGQSQPLVSTLNAVDKAITSNMAIAPTSVGSINAYATNWTYLIIDVSAYFAP